MLDPLDFLVFLEQDYASFTHGTMEVRFSRIDMTNECLHPSDGRKIFVERNCQTGEQLIPEVVGYRLLSTDALSPCLMGMARKLISDQLALGFAPDTLGFRVETEGGVLCPFVSC